MVPVSAFCNVSVATPVPVFTLSSNTRSLAGTPLGVVAAVICPGKTVPREQFTVAQLSVRVVPGPEDPLAVNVVVDPVIFV